MEDSFTTSSEFDIRYSDLSDAKPLLSWIKPPETAIWYPPESEADQESFVRNWIGFSKFRASLTATYKQVPIGVVTIFLMPYIKVAHICSVQICVDPAFRRKGVGVSLLKNIKHLAKQRFRLEAMHCEIYEGAPVEGVLQKAGFKEIIRQEKYVDLPEGPKARIIYESQL